MLYQRLDTTVAFIVASHLKDKIPVGTNQVKVTVVAPVLAVKPYEGLLVTRSVVIVALSLSIQLRETITSENGASVYPTLIGTEENPKEQAASFTLVI